MKQRHQIYLFRGKGYGRRYDKRRNFARFFISYETRKLDGSSPRKEIEWLDVETREEAKAERDRRYAELLLAGAKWKGEEPKKIVKPKKKKIHPDDFLHQHWVKKRWWKVVIDKKFVGGSYSKLEARKIRDMHLKNEQEAKLKPCPECGETPVFSKNHHTLSHGGDCPLAFTLGVRDIGKYKKIVLWNTKIRKGEFKGKEKIYLSDVEHLL